VAIGAINHLGLLGFWTLSIARYSKEHNVSETGFISVFNGWETRTLLDPVELTSITGPLRCVL
jgi:hypothetical protein